MKTLGIAFKDLLIMLKDKKAMALIILMPIILIMILGAALSSMFKGGSEVNIEKFSIAVVDNDGGEYSIHLIDFLKSDDLKKMIEVKEMDYQGAEEAVKKGNMPAAVIIPDGYSGSVESGSRAEILVLKDPGSPLRAQMIESFIKSYAGVGSAMRSSVDAAVMTLSRYNADGRAIMQDITELAHDVNMKFQEDNVDKKETISSIQYYAAGILVMYILFVGMLGSMSIIEEREQKTLTRLMSTSVSRASILSGKLLGLMMLGIVDVSVLILFTRFAFNVNWGDSIPGLIILSLSMIFAASGLAMLIASLFKSSKAVQAANPPIVLVMSFLGGSMLPLFIMPSFMQDIAKIALNNWALRGYLNLMMGNGIGAVVTPSIVMAAMGVVFLSVGILRLRLE